MYTKESSMTLEITLTTHLEMSNWPESGQVNRTLLLADGSPLESKLPSICEVNVKLLESSKVLFGFMVRFV